MAPELVNRARLRNYLTRLELRAMREKLEQSLAELDRMPTKYHSAEFLRTHGRVTGLIADVTAMIERLRAESGKEL